MKNSNLDFENSILAGGEINNRTDQQVVIQQVDTEGATNKNYNDDNFFYQNNDAVGPDYSNNNNNEGSILNIQANT